MSEPQLCPRCGSPKVSVVGCQACGATFVRPMSFQEPEGPVDSAAVHREILIDRRQRPRSSEASSDAPSSTWVALAKASLQQASSEEPAWSKSAAGTSAGGDPAWSKAPEAPMPSAPQNAEGPAWTKSNPAPDFSPRASAPTAPGTLRGDIPIVLDLSGTRSLGGAILPIQSRPSGPPIAAAAQPLPEQKPAEPLPERPALDADVGSAAGSERLSPPDEANPRPRSEPQPEGAFTEVHALPAGIAARAVAWLIDAAVLMAFSALLMLAARRIAAPVTSASNTSPALLGLALALLGTTAFVYSVLCLSLKGRTLGKSALGLCVLDPAGRPPRPGLAARRALLSMVSLLPFGLGFAMALFDDRQQTFHDRMSGTFVVRRLDTSPTPEEVP